jgi:hypothetical protein
MLSGIKMTPGRKEVKLKDTSVLWAVASNQMPGFPYRVRESQLLLVLRETMPPTASVTEQM